MTNSLFAARPGRAKQSQAIQFKVPVGESEKMTDNLFTIDPWCHQRKGGSK